MLRPRDWDIEWVWWGGKASTAQCFAPSGLALCSRLSCSPFMLLPNWRHTMAAPMLEQRREVFLSIALQA